MAILSLYQGLSAEADQLRSDLAELVGHSNVEKRFEDAGGGLVMITPTPFHWEPLPASARSTQARLREAYKRFSGLVRAVLAGEPDSTKDKLTGLEQQFLNVVNQDKSTEYDTAAKAGDHAVQALARQFAYVEQLHSGEGDPILVPDTNALIFNPALETWRFDDVPRFRMALTPTVLRELDVLKTRNGVREKAERLIRQIREYRRRGRLFDGVPLRKDVSSIFSVATEPLMEASLPWLDPASEDDRLIAVVIDIARRHVRVPVALVTRDTNVENKADFAGLACLYPPEPPELPSIDDPETGERGRAMKGDSRG
jgi:hypothetical protein